jgi:hypothetical protein
MTDTPIDVVRASRDGHQYHEAWMARRALGLLLARDGLRGIAVEGLWLEDEADISQPAIEIADATFYYGSPRQFKDATSVEIAQFKYSIAHASTDLRFFDFKKTFQKFEIAEADLAARHGTEATQSKLRYSLITNRPIAPALVEALKSLAAGTTPQTRDAQDQHEQILKAATLQGDQLRSFAFRMSLVGKAGHLQTLESGNAQIIADWSASHDVLARARLGDLRSLVRSKAGSSGQKDNLITTVDVLAALGVAHENELLPAPKAFPEIGPIVDRAQLSDFVAKIDQSPHWIVHAAGGIGKTVFAQSVASRLSAQDEVVLFDCFGGGAYRSIADGRHRPERGLLHIVNELACRGLSDLILPGSSDPSEVVRRSLERFTQAIEVLRRTKANARLIIIIDAADNAADEADRRNQLSFPRELLETLSLKSPVDGLIVIATARTERRNLAIGRASCAPFELTPFSIEETTAFVQARRPKATAMQIEAISRRSDGNPRVIDNLIEPGRSLTGESEELGKVDLTDLIKERLARAIGLANQKGAGDDAVHAFLCALSVLPPPVPIDEMAVAFGIASAEVESFAADLSPLLERTRHGIIFRDEPTETLVRSQYGSKLPLLDEVVTRLTHA